MVGPPGSKDALLEEKLSHRDVARRRRRSDAGKEVDGGLAVDRGADPEQCEVGHELLTVLAKLPLKGLADAAGELDDLRLAVRHPEPDHPWPCGGGKGTNPFEPEDERREVAGDLR